MKKTIVTTIMIGIMGVVLASCSSGKPQPTLAQFIAEGNRQDNISPTPYTGAPTTFLNYSVVDGVDPHMFSSQAIKGLSKQQVFADASWWHLMPAPSVFTIMSGRRKGDIILKVCEQGVWNNTTHYFQPGPTLGPAIPAGSPVEVPIKKNGKIVMIDGHAAVKTEPAPPGDHEPGPFYAWGVLSRWNGKNWGPASSSVSYIFGNWSCSNA